MRNTLEYKKPLVLTQHIEELLARSKAERKIKNPAGLIFADEALELSEEIKSLPLKIAALMEKAKYAFMINCDFPVAETLCLELIELMDPNDTAIGDVYNMIGVCYDLKGNYFESRIYHRKSIELLEKHKDESDDIKISLGNAYYNITRLYSQVWREEEDLHNYLDKARELFESINFVEGLGRVWSMKGSRLPNDRPLEERLGYFEKSYSFHLQGSDKKGTGAVLGNIGLCHCRLKNFDKGIPALTQAITLLNDANAKQLSGFTMFQLGEAYRYMGDSYKAIECLKEAEQVLISANAQSNLLVVYKEWAHNLSILGKFEEAYAMVMKFTDEFSGLLDFDKQSAIAEAQLKFELGKKEQEWEMLKKKNEEIELFNQKLKHSSAELNQFAYVASHDLKEPLRMVTNYMQLLEKSMDKKLTDDQATFIRYANEGAKRMYKLIDSLLVFSRSTIDSEVKLVNLNDVTDQVQRIVLSSAKRNVQINVDELPTILGDHNQMVQLFQNLVANAVKYNDKDECIIHISYTPELNAHRITVEDNGIGIPLRYRETVFEIFKRLHDRESYSGTGIGLSICRKIIHALNGRIWIEDSAMGGAAFVFTIPKKSSLPENA